MDSEQEQLDLFRAQELLPCKSPWCGVILLEPTSPGSPFSICLVQHSQEREIIDRNSSFVILTAPLNPF